MTLLSISLAAAQQELEVVTWTAGYDDRLFKAYVLVELMAGARRTLQVDTLAHGCPTQREPGHAFGKSAGGCREFPDGRLDRA